MPIVPLKPLLTASQKYGFAHGAFNVNAVAQAKAIVEVHEMFRSAAIIQGADLANAFMGGRTDFMNGTLEDKIKGAKNIAEAVRRFAEKSFIPIVMHLDHGKSFEACKAAIDGGYTSVMIDGSHLPYEENVALTREVVKFAHPLGVSVEGELGVLAGVEDAVVSGHSTYTNPMAVADFFKKTKVDCLAISYGTMHGANKGANARIRKEIAIAAKENLLHEGIEGVFVSHGSSTVPAYIVEEVNALGGNVQNAHGIPVEQLQSVIPFGIGKINVDTDIRLAVTRNVREYFAKNPHKKKEGITGMVWAIMEKNPEYFDPRQYITPLMHTVMTGEIPDEDTADLVQCIELGVKEAVGMLIVQFGSAGYADKVEIITLEQMAEHYKK